MKLSLRSNRSNARFCLHPRKLEEISFYETRYFQVRDDNHFGFTIRYFDGSRHNLMVNQNADPLVHRKVCMLPLSGEVSALNINRQAAPTSNVR